MKHGAFFATLGVALGVAVALAVTRVLQGFLYEVAPTDALTFAAVAGILLTVAMAACLVPARRATNVDPAVALRSN